MIETLKCQRRKNDDQLAEVKMELPTEKPGVEQKVSQKKENPNMAGTQAKKVTKSLQIQQIATFGNTEK